MIISNNPLVSVVTVTYNNAKYLQDTIKSVLSQTFKNFEYIVWDDGSTDNTKEIVDSFDDPRIRYYYEPNQGIGLATRKACSKTNGQYIARLDGDDMWLPDKLQVQVDYMEANKDVVACGTSEIYIDDKNNVVGVLFHYTNPVTIKKILSKHSAPIFHSSSIFRKDVYEQIGGYVNIKSCLDTLLWKRMVHAGSIVNLPVHLACYRLHGSTITVSRSNGPYGKILVPLMDKILNEEGRNEDDNKLYDRLYALNKELVKKQNIGAQQYNMKATRLSLPYRAYLLLSKILGKRNASNLIFKMKDIYGTYKFK